MKALILFLVLFSTSLYASSDCSTNSYGLTRESLAVALDWESGQFHSRSVHAVMGEYFFNDLIDQSCEKISVSKQGQVSCTDSTGSSVVVGVLKEKIGNDEDFVYYSVNWARAVVIKSQSTPRGCVYGMAVL